MAETTKYYFAGAYARRAELAGYAAQLSAAVRGSRIVSSWLHHDCGVQDAGFSADGLTTPEAVETAWIHGGRDLADLGTADAIVSFTGAGGRGGRHIEHGYAIARTEIDDPREWAMSRLIVVGPREHVFHCHPATEVYPDFEAFLKHEIGRYGRIPDREDDE